jgi:hypothetical protein
MGDLIIGRRNDSTMRISQAEHDVPAADPVRNGNCWRVAAVDADRNRIATRRLSDGPAIFGGDNMREHITDGNAVTVHAAQGVTADTSHAVLGENASRAALYMAMARVRESNNAYRYQHEAEASEYGDARPDGLHVPPSSSGKSSPPMRAHRPHTNSPPKPVETVCQHACQPCSSTAAPTVGTRGERRTASGAQRRWRSNSLKWRFCLPARSPRVVIVEAARLSAPRRCPRWCARSAASMCIPRGWVAAYNDCTSAAVQQAVDRTPRGAFNPPF